ncbi:MAG: DUF86 domain-containing protein [Candidatus Thermoplasmatota archaeon]|nr:DUF86 domain-containing protein [Candidatus Thermoplasmatota archaeon]
MKEIKIYLNNISENIDQIENDVEGMLKEEFLKDKKTQRSVLWGLAIIGEAIKNIPSKMKEKYPEINWKGVIGMRNIIIYRYSTIRMEDIWYLVKNKLPELKQVISELLKEREPSE